MKKLFRFRFGIYELFFRFCKYLFWLTTVVKKHEARRKPRVKLVAIAKNEACYLPEWLAHHYYFGFKHISVYVNNTTDNTTNIIQKLKSINTIEFCDGDKYFQPEIDVPQVEIYKFELKRSKKQGFSHVMFLDIDEFWTPKNLTTSIYDFLSTMKTDVVCFEWLNRTNESRTFLPAIQKKVEGIKGNHVKSLVSTNILLEAMNPHNVLAYKIEHQLADGKVFKVDEENFAKISRSEVNSELKDIFVLHRMYRSEEEYVALLMRGRPVQNRPFVDLFKTNRSGYIPNQKKVKVFFDDESTNSYKRYIHNFLANYKLLEEVELGKVFIMNIREQVPRIISESPFECLDILSKIFNRVKLPDITSALKAKKAEFEKNS